MTGDVRVERSEDRGTWDALVGALGDRTGFHSWAWLDVHARTRGVVIERLLVLEDGTPVGVFPLPRHSARALTGAVLPFPYLGPLVPERLLPATVEALRRWQRRHGLAIARFELPPPLAAAADGALSPSRHQTVTNTTVQVDLASGSIDDVRSRYSSMRRRDLRRAVRDGVTVRDARPGEVTALLPAVLEDIFHGRGLPSPYPSTIGAEVEAFAAEREDVGVIVAELEDRPVGIQVALGSPGGTALAWVGGCLKEYRRANPNVVLYDRLLEWGVETGHRAVDLCGEVDRGVLQYKMAFGGVEKSYLGVESSIVPWSVFEVGSRVRQILRRSTKGRSAQGFRTSAV